VAWHPFRNLGMKIVSVILGTMLWFTVSSDYLVERSIRVPLVYLNTPPTLEISPDAPDQVEVHLRGRVSQLTSDQGDVIVYIDLADARSGSRLFHLRTDQVTTPFGIEATQVFPSTVMLTLETTGNKTVNVEATVEGKPAAGFDIGKITVDPPVVVVIGPESELKALRSAITETVLIEGAKEPVTRSVSIGVMNSSLRLKESRTARVTVDVVRKK
jgi:YbbR domain-containing protein